VAFFFTFNRRLDVILRLSHIAIAVPDLEAAIQRLVEDLGLPMEGREDVAAALTRTAFFPVQGTRIELVHPLDGKGPIAGFLEKKGPGLHHICFETDDIDADVEKLRARGYQFLAPAPTPGAHGTRVIFIHPRCFDGVLVELAQPGHEAS
jgi:methylmalonyl-CoA/ethylmalonyl-CoA epimerase